MAIYRQGDDQKRRWDLELVSDMTAPAYGRVLAALILVPREGLTDGLTDGQADD